MEFKIGDIVTCVAHTEWDETLLHKKFVIVEKGIYTSYWVKFLDGQLFDEDIEIRNCSAIRHERREGLFGVSSLRLVTPAAPKVIKPYPIVAFLERR